MRSSYKSPLVVYDNGLPWTFVAWLLELTFASPRRLRTLLLEPTTGPVLSNQEIVLLAVLGTHLKRREAVPPIESTKYLWACIMKSCDNTKDKPTGPLKASLWDKSSVATKELLAGMAHALKLSRSQRGYFYERIGAVALERVKLLAWNQ